MKRHVPNPTTPRGSIQRGVPAGDRAPVTRKPVDRIGSRTKYRYCPSCGAKRAACHCDKGRA